MGDACEGVLDAAAYDHLARSGCFVCAIEPVKVVESPADAHQVPDTLLTRRRPPVPTPAVVTGSATSMGRPCPEGRPLCVSPPAQRAINNMSGIVSADSTVDRATDRTARATSPP